MKAYSDIAAALSERKVPKLVHRYKLTASYSIKYPTIKTDADLMQLASMIKKDSGIMQRRRYITWVGTLQECNAAKLKILAHAKKHKMLIATDYARVQ